MNNKLAQVDSLRGIAILMVILIHTGQSISDMSSRLQGFTLYGQLGVQLFFVMSAFTLSLSADRRDTEEDKTKKYIVRRFFRIAPLYYVGIIWYFLYYSILTSIYSKSLQLANWYTPVNMLANFLFVHGFYPPANNNIVPGGWSIGTEMSFYVCFPALFLMFRKISERGKMQLPLLFTLLVCCYYFLESRYVSWVGTLVERNTFLYYNLLNQLPVFTLGILSYFLVKNKVMEKIPTILNIIFCSLFAWITTLLWHTDTFLQAPFMIIPLTAGLAFVFLYNIYAKIEILNHPLLQRIGQLSYSMYILHFMFAWNMSQYLSKQLEGTIKSKYVLVLLYGLTVFLSFVLATISEKFIEKPGINVGRRIVQKISEQSMSSDHH